MWIVSLPLKHMVSHLDNQEVREYNRHSRIAWKEAYNLLPFRNISQIHKQFLWDTKPGYCQFKSKEFSVLFFLQTRIC